MRGSKLAFLFLFGMIALNTSAQSPVADSLNKIIRENRLDKQEAVALNNMAIEYARSDMAKAKAYLYRSMDIGGKIKNDTLLANAEAQMVTLQQNTGQKDSAMYFLQMLHQRSLKNPSPLVRDDYNFTAGLLYKIQGNNKMALPFMQEALKSYIQTDKSIHSTETRTGLAGQYLNIGNVYMHLGEYRPALQNHIKALKLFEEVDNKRGLSFSYQCIGSDFKELGQFRQAERYVRQALILKTSLNDKRGMATAYGDLGSVYQGMEQYDSALRFYQEALKIIQEMKLTAEEARVYFDMGKTYRMKQDVVGAELYLRKSRQLAEQLGDTARSASADAELVALGSAVRRTTIEEKQLLHSLNTSERMGDRNSELQNYRYLSDHYAENKQFDKALIYLKKSFALHDSLQNNELQVQVKNLEEQYNLDKKEKEIELLKKDQQLSLLHLQKNKTFQLAAMLFIFFLALTGFLIFNRYRIISKARRLIEMEKMRNHIARDLHDDIGSTLTSIHIISKVSLQDELAGNPDMAENMKKINDRTGAIMESMNDIVWTINPQHDTMEQMLYRMKEFAAEILEPAQINYRFEEEGEISSVRLDIQKRKDFYLLFKEAVNNAAKHSACQTLKIRLSYSANTLRLTIEDDGKGFDENDIRPGNGLENMRARAQAMNAQLKLDSVKGRSTRISLDMSIT